MGGFVLGRRTRRGIETSWVIEGMPVDVNDASVARYFELYFELGLFTGSCVSSVVRLRAI